MKILKVDTRRSEMILTPKSVLQFLKDIESGVVTLTCRNPESPAEVYAANVHYHASNGWQLVIFNDCGEWDYIDHVKTGETLTDELVDFERIYETTTWRHVRQYLPSLEVSRNRYGIPGYGEASMTPEWAGWKP